MAIKLLLFDMISYPPKFSKKSSLKLSKRNYFFWTPPLASRKIWIISYEKSTSFWIERRIAKTQWEQISYAIWPPKVVKFVQIFTFKLLEDQFETKQDWLDLLYFFPFLCHTPFLLANFHMGIRWILWLYMWRNKS